MVPRPARRLPRDGTVPRRRPGQFRRADLCARLSRDGRADGLRPLHPRPPGAKPLGRGRADRGQRNADPALVPDGRSGAGAGHGRMVPRLGDAAAPGDGPLPSGRAVAERAGASTRLGTPRHDPGDGRAWPRRCREAGGRGLPGHGLVRLGPSGGGRAGSRGGCPAAGAGRGRDPDLAAARHARDAEPAGCAQAGDAAAGGGPAEPRPGHGAG